MGRLRTYYQAAFNSASLTGSYQDFGVDLTDECVSFSFWNLSDVDAYIGQEGLADDLRIPAGKELKFAPSEPDKRKFAFAKGTQLQIKQVTAAGTGNIIGNFVLEG